MASTKYTYSIANDTLNGILDPDALEKEIRDSAILTAFDYLETVGDVADIWFKAALSVDDATLLDALVAAHTGVPLPSAPELVKIDGLQTADKRLTIRQTIVNNSVAFRPRSICFYTADPSKLYNKNPAGADYEDVTAKCYDANGDEITQAPYTAAVKTVLDFEPTYYYEMIGGGIDIPTALRDGTTDAWYASCVGLPDISAEYGGNIDLINETNLEADMDSMIRLDGRGVLGLPYDAQQHTNKLRFQFKHPAGESKRFQLRMEIFR